MPTDAPFTVAVIDDDAGFREAVAWLLRGAGYAVQCYADTTSFVEHHDVEALGCLLLDLRLVDESGIDAMRRIRSKAFDMPIIMISGHGDISIAVRAVQLGAAGFMEKPADNQQLTDAVAAACAAHSQQVGKYGRATVALRNYALLTAREQDVFWGIAEGLSTKEIAALLDISVRTAETHRARVFQKWGAGAVADIHKAAFFLRDQRPDSD